MFKREIQKYDNGLTHIHYYVPFVKTVTMIFFVNAGSSDEKLENEYGISHFLEHMLFNGSEKYPDSVETEKRCAGLGLYQNAWTWFTETVYFIQSPARSFEPAFDILFQRVYKPKLRQKDVNKEIGIIQEEIVMGENDPETLLFYEIWLGLNKGTTYEHKVLGTRDSVGGMNKKILKDYHTDYYSPNNSAFVTYGGMKFDQVQELVQDSLDSLLPKEIPVHNPHPGRSKKYKPTKKIEIKKDVDINYYANITKGRKLVSLSDSVHAMVLRSLLVGGQGSFFNRKLQIEDSLVSSYELDIYNFADYSMTVFESSTTKDNIDKMHNIAKSVLEDPGKIINSDDFERAKNYAYGSAVRSLEEVKLPSQISLENIEINNFRNETEFSYGDITSQFDEISIESLRDFAAEYFGGGLQGEGFVFPK